MDSTAAAEVLRELLPYVRGRSPLTEHLLAGLAAAAERPFDGGALARLLTAGDHDPAEARLLVLAALHHAALTDPSLPHAAWYPTATGDVPARDAASGAVAALALAYLIEHEEAVAGFVATHRVQTNEPARCAALLPGFLHAAAPGLPLRLLELGASAGLNLRFDRYRYRYADGPSWGPEGGPHLDTRAEGAVPARLVPPSVEVVERRGVDLRPFDLEDPGDLRLLRSFVWADEPARHERLTAAIQVARATPATVEAGDLVAAAATVTPQAGTATVVFQSQVRHLLVPAARAELEDALDAALRAGSADAPVSVLVLEPPRGVPDDGSNWPELVVGTGDGSGPPRWVTLVSADWHGRWVRWFA